VPYEHLSVVTQVSRQRVGGASRKDCPSPNLDANTLSVLTNNGSGGFVLASSPGVGSRPESVTAADVNGDGKVDLMGRGHRALVFNRLAERLAVLRIPNPRGVVIRSR